MDSYSKFTFWQEKSKKDEIKMHHKQKCTRNMELSSASKVSSNVSESQNFILQLSEDSITDDIDDVALNNKKYTNNKADVIVISDSSFDTAPEHFTKKQESATCSENRTNAFASDEIYVLDSSSTESLIAANENILRLQQNKKSCGNSDKQSKNENHKKKSKNKFNRLYICSSNSDSNSDSSDEVMVVDNNRIIDDSDVTHVSLSVKDDNENIDDSDVTHVSSLQPVRDDIRHFDINKKNVPVKQLQNSNNYRNLPSSRSCSSASTESSNETPTSNDKIIRSNGKTSNNSDKEIKNSIEWKLTKKDVRTIYRNIKATKIMYQSPSQKNVIIDESMEEETHPAISPEHYTKKPTEICQNKIINETPSVETQDSIVPSSQINLPNQCKTLASRFLQGECGNLEYTDLSNRKKQEISRWLISNSPDSKSDSSFSQITHSNRNSVSSGNSSLERLEKNYETPNNRDRIRKVSSSGKKLFQLNDPLSLNEHKIINDLCTPKKRTTGKEHNDMQKESEVTTNDKSTEKNVAIKDCAEILDKLYGNAWRSKADALFTNSEPRKHNTYMTNKAVQTEKKSRKPTQHSTGSEEDSLLFLKNVGHIKPGNNLLQKPPSRTKKRNSFINDESTSGSDSESTYYTAVINPKTPNGVHNTPKPSATKSRIFEICDSDTEEDNCDNNINGKKGFDRRKLSFTEDEDSSNTSEFDPGDYVPPKPVLTKEKPNTIQQKTSSVPANYKEQYNFLNSLSETVPLSKVHPDAKKYRTDFKNTKEELSKRLYKLYNEKVFEKQLPEDMLIEWNVRMRGTAGYCYNRKSVKSLGTVVKSSRIVLSTKVLDRPGRLRDTLIHEMCHAAAWIINNVSDGHGPFWTKWANKAMKTFPELPPIRRCHDYDIKTKFTYKCTGCGYSIGRHSKSLNTEKKRCGYCYGKFELLVNKTTKNGSVVQMQTPNRQPSKFALFVKEHYNTVKKERNVKHAEIMKILGQQFSAIKIAKKDISEFQNNPDTSS